MDARSGSRLTIPRHLFAVSLPERAARSLRRLGRPQLAFTTDSCAAMSHPKLAAVTAERRPPIRTSLALSRPVPHPRPLPACIRFAFSHSPSVIAAFLSVFPLALCLFLPALARYRSRFVTASLSLYLSLACWSLVTVHPRRIHMQIVKGRTTKRVASHSARAWANPLPDFQIFVRPNA